MSSAQEFQMINSETKELSPREKQLKMIVDSVRSDKYIVHSETRPDKSVALKISSPGNMKWSFEIQTPPMVVQWPRLHSDGNLGTKFAQEKKQAVFEANVGGADLFALEQVVGDAAEGLAQCHEDFFAQMDILFKAAEQALWDSPELLVKKKAGFIEMAKDSVAAQADCDVSELEDSDERVQKMAMRFFKSNANVFVNRSKDSPFLRVKARVFKQAWGEPDSEAVNKPVPILNARGERLNDEDNSEAIINHNDLVSCKFCVRPYCIPSGSYGISCALQAVTLIKSGSNKKKKHTHDFAAWSN
jgi:hypothetical protein